VTKVLYALIGNKYYAQMLNADGAKVPNTELLNCGIVPNN
jgi:hypothetical protein